MVTKARLRSQRLLLTSAFEGAPVAVVWLALPWILGSGTRLDFALVLPAFVAALVSVAMLRKNRSSVPMAVSQVDDVRHVGNVSALSGAAAVMASLILNHAISAAAVVAAVLLSGVILLIVRGLDRRLRSRFGAETNVVVIGAGVDATEIAELLVDHPESRLNLIGVIGHGPTAAKSGLEPLWLGDTADLTELLQHHNVTEAIVLPTGFRTAGFRRVIAELTQFGIDPLLSSGVARLGAPSLKVNSLVHEPLIRLDSRKPRRALTHVAARVLDIAGASFLLALSSPLLLVAAIAIKVGDRGPVFYLSPRIGQNHEPFGMYKLRSMAPDADERKNELANRNERSGPLFKVSNDPRITRVGRVLRETSMDEIPQFVNVLLGHMSLVGPRPALPEEAAAFDEQLQSRFEVRPGITGLWQVEARTNASFEAYQRLDLHYVNSRSLLLDLQILMATSVQIIVSIIILPLKVIIRTQDSDGVSSGTATPQASSVIDLRDRAQAKFAAHSATASQADQAGG